MHSFSYFAAAFAASFCYVGLKAFQQLNVVHGQYLWVIPISIGMAACEVYVVASVVKTGWDLPMVLLIGLGSGLGCIASMYTHKLLTKGKGK